MRRTRRLRRQRTLAAVLLAGLALAAAAVLAANIAVHRPAPGADTWRGLAVAPENRCSHYDRDDYRYPQSVEAQIVAAMGGRVYGPYTGRLFRSPREVDIEHIVAVAEAHDSGLCAASPDLRLRFASDLLNLTLAAPEVNRCTASGKCAHDAAAWLPPMNRCWFAARVVAVKRKYGLSIDAREAAALERVLAGCDSTRMIVTGSSAPAASTRTVPDRSVAARCGPRTRSGPIEARHPHRDTPRFHRPAALSCPACAPMVKPL